MFTLIKKDKKTKARAGKIKTAHGVINTPNFAPVATGGVIKTLSAYEVEKAGVQFILSNAYHLYLKPGKEIIKKAGGLHNFMKWDRPIISDSGGYQVFSLAGLRKIRKEGVEFQSHIDGSRHYFTPESVIEFQMLLGTDVMMVLDECVHYPATKDYTQQSLKLTTDWAKRSKRHCELRRSEAISEKGIASVTSFPRNDGGLKQQLFGIVQGGTYPDLRKQAVEQLVGIGFDGYAIGGLSVGEPRDVMCEILDITAPLLPENKARYLMGVGKPNDIFEAVEHGMDIFDCIIPTRLGRNGTAFTSCGKLIIRDAKFANDFRPVDKECSCFCCQNYSRAYIRHILNITEMLAKKLLSLHNIYFYVKLMDNIRQSILDDRFFEFKKEFLKNYG